MRVEGRAHFWGRSATPAGYRTFGELAAEVDISSIRPIGGCAPRAAKGQAHFWGRSATGYWLPSSPLKSIFQVFDLSAHAPRKSAPILWQTTGNGWVCAYGPARLWPGAGRTRSSRPPD